MITMKGEESDLASLLKMIEQTGGDVEIMDPKILEENNFSNILSNQTIATKV